MVFFFEIYVLERCDYDNDDTTITHDTTSLGVYITDVNSLENTAVVIRHPDVCRIE